MADVKMNYESLQAMAAVLKQSHIEMLEMKNVMMKIADMLNDGALVNAQGERWADALRTTINQALTRGEELFDELAGDVLGAMGDLSSEDSEAAGRFS